MSLTNLAQQLAVIETTHGMDLLCDYVSWIETDGITTVAAVSGRRKSMVKKYHRECLMVCVWVPDPHKEIDQNDDCGTTRPGR